MVKRETAEKIQELKHEGHTVPQIVIILKKEGIIPSEPTIYKYYKMPFLPDDLNAKLHKKMVFDQEPWKSTIISTLEGFTESDVVYVTSIYDILIEIYIEPDDSEYEELPGCLRTLQNYVKYLLEAGLVHFQQAGHRVYHYVTDIRPGEQMLVDFGEQELKNGVRVYFICLLLRYSQFLYVSSQDHKYNAEEACTSICRAFRRIGGRPEKLVIDQDAVFVSSEVYGEVVETRAFELFLNYKRAFG